jgi:DDE_Tnp_1-associated
MNGEEFGRSLVEAWQQVPDPRKARGKRHPLGAILTQAVAAMLSGARSVDAIAQWGRAQAPGVVRTLGYTREKTPAGSTFHEVFKALDVEAFERVLSQWAQQHLGPGEAIAIDGKALRGIHGEELPGVRLVAAYAHRAGRVLAQAGGPAPASSQSRGG